MDELTPLALNAWLWIGLCVVWLISSIFVYRNRIRENFFQRSLHVIPLYVGYFLIFRHPSAGWGHGMLYTDDAPRYGGDVVTFFGVAVAIWARLTLGRYWSGNVALKEHHRLIRSGPYRFTRHPLYTGFIVGVIGSAIAAARVDAWIGAAIAIASLIFKLRREEKLLTREFGEKYVEFKRDVPAAVWPGIY